MAEDIRQEFVFDAATALKTIETLTSRYEKLNTVLRSHAKTVKGLNTSTRKITGGLIQIKNAAKAAANQLSRVYGAKAAAATAKATKGTGAAAAPPVDTAQVNKAKASLQELDAVARKTFTGAPIKNQKLFKKGINDLVAAFHRSGGSVAEFKTRLATLDRQVNGTATRMRSAMRQIAKSTKKATDASPLRNFTVSWQTMVRIVTTQLIVRSLNVLRQAMRDAISESIEFQRAIAEVGTIANDALGGLSDISQIVRQTSDEFGKSRLDVAEGLYQTLSNQVGDAAESLHVFQVANKLSIAAVGSTEDSVNLLTAALNGFDISVTQSETVAAKLFKTVELGRTRMSELANTLGRVGPLANALGISLDETLAAIATITVQGTKTAESLTQLRGVMQGMIKPSDEMKKVFKEMGIASAEAGVATFGFQGFLDEMTKVTGKSTSEMGKLIRRVRGLLGAVTLASEDAEKFIENLEKIEEATSELLEQKFKLVFETPGEELAREFNRLKNILVVDIGAALVDASLSIIDFTKSMGSLLVTTSQYAVVIGAVLVPAFAAQLGLLFKNQIAWLVLRKEIIVTKFATLAAAKASIAAAVATTKAWLVAAAPFIAIAAAVGLVVYALKSVDSQIQSGFNNINKLIQAHYELEQAVSTKALENHYAIQNKINELNVQDTLKILAATQKAYQEQADVVAEFNRAEIDNTKAKFDTILDSLQDFQSEYENIAKESNDAILDSQKRVYDIEQQGDKDRFTRSIRWLSQQEQVFAQQKRITDLNRQAQKLLVTGDPEEIQKVLKMYSEVENIYGNLRDLTWEQLEPLERAWRAGELSADRFNDLQKARRADNVALKLGTNLTNARLAAEKKLQAIEQRKAQLAAERAAKLAELNVAFEHQFDVITSNMKQFDKDNQRLSAEELQKQATARANAFAEIRSLAKELPGTFDYQDFFGLAQLSAQLNDTLSDQQMTISEDSINKIGESIGKAFDNFLSKSMEVRLRELSRILGVEFDPSRGFAELSQAVVDSKDRMEELNNKVRDLGILEAKVLALRQKATQELDVGAGLQIPPGALAATEAFSQLLARQAGGVQLTVVELQQMETHLTTIRGAWDGIGDRSERLYSQLRLSMNTIQEWKIAQAKLKEDQAAYNQLAAQNELANTEQALGAAASNRNELLQSTTAVRSQETEAAQGTVSYDQRLLELGKQRKDTEAAILKLKQAQAQAEAKARTQVTKEKQATAAASAVQRQAKGGLIRGYMQGGLVKNLMYLAKGNLARGTDTIPAMLSPGEFVMNAKSTRRFYSQLVAMNRGQKPIYRQEGGTVTNVSVGDVHVQGGKNPAQTGRQIVGAIKRELRRGTSSF